MEGISIRVQGLGSLDTDLETEIKKINKKVPNALSYVGSEMAKGLHDIVEDYFYKSYTPRHYQRSGAMSDVSAMDYTSKKNELIFTYAPDTTNNDLDNWVQDKPVNGEFSLPRHPDDLIIWGQHSHFDGTEHEINARPFWNYFLEEQGNEKILDNFVCGMAPNYQVIKDEGERVDLSEFTLLADSANIAPYKSNADSD